MIHRPKKVIACPVEGCEREPSKQATPFCTRHIGYAKYDAETGEAEHATKEKVLIEVTGEVRYYLRRLVAMPQEEYLQLLKADVEEDQPEVNGIVTGWLEADLMDAINNADDGEIEEGDFSFYRPEKIRVERKRKAKKKK